MRLVCSCYVKSSRRPSLKSNHVSQISQKSLIKQKSAKLTVQTNLKGEEALYNSELVDISEIFQPQPIYTSRSQANTKNNPSPPIPTPKSVSKIIGFTINPKTLLPQVNQPLITSTPHLLQNTALQPISTHPIKSTKSAHPAHSHKKRAKSKQFERNFVNSLNGIAKTIAQ